MKPQPKCTCGDLADVIYDGRPWCAFCALLCIGDMPADRFAEVERAFHQLGEGARYIGIVDGQLAMTAVGA